MLAVPSVEATSSPIRVNTTVGQADGGRTDIVRVRLTGSVGEGAIATLYRRVEERSVRSMSARLDAAGKAELRARDRNGRNYTKYFVVVGQTDDNLARRGPIKIVR